ncbi:hypothetical protein V8E54_007864 [Elaphomyces granulatus]
MSNSSGKITCYSYTGIGYTNNTKCPQNDSCCQTAAQCRDDRLCVANGGEDGIYVRATCVNRPWTLATCAQICLYDNSDGYLPRVNICSDGSYCCGNDTYCCVNKAGLFLSKDGEIIGYANQTTTTTTSAKPTSTTTTSTTTSTSSLTSATSSATQTSASGSNTSSGLSEGGKVGVGVGGLALILLALFWFLYRRRQKNKVTTDPRSYPAPPLPPQELDEADMRFQLHAVSTLKPAQPVELRPLVELPASSLGQSSPVELPNNQT